MKKQNNINLFFSLTSFLALIVFAIIMYLFTKINIQSKNHIIDIWIFCGLFLIPIAFYMLFLNFISSKISYYFYSIYNAILTGLWMGIALNSIFVIDKWYQNPDNGKFEPLSIMLGICTACIIYMQKLLNIIYQKDNKILDDE